VLKTQQIEEMQKDTKDRIIEEAWKLHSEYAQEKLGKKLRRIAKSHDSNPFNINRKCDETV
jgi:hypothetical protein